MAIIWNYTRSRLFWEFFGRGFDSHHLHHHNYLEYFYIRDFELGEASDKLKIGIKKFAEFLGVHDKFHYILTTTFVC